MTKELKPEFTEKELEQLIPVIGKVTDRLLQENSKNDFMMVTDQPKIVEQYTENYSRYKEISIHEILQKDSPYKLFYIWTRNAITKSADQILNLECFSKQLITERKKLIKKLESRI